MTLPPRPVTRKDVKKFVDHCVILRAFWTHYQMLFEGSDLKRELLESTAHKFFHDLNLMLIEHLILQICKLSDPEITCGKRNLTIQFLTKNADFSASPRELAKLTKIAARIDAFRARILPARNKFISYLDLDAAPGAPRRARQSKALPDCRATTIKSPVTKISLALPSRRDNHLLAATAQLAILFAATLPSRLSRYTRTYPRGPPARRVRRDRRTCLLHRIYARPRAGVVRVRPGRSLVYQHIQPQGP
jgi:hypothetical protein